MRMFTRQLTRSSLRPRGYGAWLRLVRRRLLCLGAVSALVTAGSLAAQTPPAGTPPLGRLSVHPHEMAIGTRNDRAGEQSLDSLDDFLVYVPEQCVGTQRCSLVVSLLGGGERSNELMRLHRPFADKYGMILLVPEPVYEKYEVEVGFGKKMDAGVGIPSRSA